MTPAAHAEILLPVARPLPTGAWLPAAVLAAIAGGFLSSQGKLFGSDGMS